MIFALMAVVCKAQDLIVTKDSKRIKVLVTQVTKDRVRYKRFDNADGPTYYIPVSKVSYIRYEDGAIDRFDDEEEEEEYDDYAPARSRATTSPARSTRQTRSDDDYYDTRSTTRRTTAASRAPSSQRYYDDGYANSRNNEPFTNAIQWSIRAGLNINSMSVGGTADDIDFISRALKTKIGFNLGVLGDYAFTDMFGLQSGLILNTRGANAEGKESDYYYDYSATATVSIYELLIPVQLTLNIWLSDYSNTSLKLHAGPTLGIALAGSGEVTETYSSDYYDYYDDTDTDTYDGIYSTYGDYVNRFNLGFTIGGGFQFDRFYIGLAYDFGLTNLAKNYNINHGTVNVKTNSLMVNLGYSF
jgi:hypothetical protein